MAPFAGIPSIVGPFNVFDARVYLSQSVFDLGAINDARSHAHASPRGALHVSGSRDFVFHVAATLYIQALAASARADAARAQEETARALFNQATTSTGRSGAGIDVLRAEVRAEQGNAAGDVDCERRRKGQAAARAGDRPARGQQVTLDPTVPVPAGTGRDV